MKLKSDKRLYQRVELCKNSKKKTTLVHRIVAKEFIKNNFNKPYVNHINEKTYDNRAENLEWCTNSENLMHNNVNKRKRRKTVGKRVAQINTNGCKIAEFECLPEVKEKYGYSTTSISLAARNGKISHGYFWKYI